MDTCQKKKKKKKKKNYIFKNLHILAQNIDKLFFFNSLDEALSVIKFSLLMIFILVSITFYLIRLLFFLFPFCAACKGPQNNNLSLTRNNQN